MKEDFRSLSVTNDGPNNFMSQMDLIKSNLQSFINQVSQSWKGESFDTFSSEANKCISNCQRLRNQVSGLLHIVDLINLHTNDLNLKEKLERENHELYPDLYWYDSDGDRHTNKSILRHIRANEKEIARLNTNLERYENKITNVTGGE